VLCLALDTTTPGGSCAVVRDGVILREAAGDRSRPPASAEVPSRSRRNAQRGGGHDTRLPGDLMALLEEARVDLRAIDWRLRRGSRW
jgi:hypothetical protein